MRAREPGLFDAKSYAMFRHPMESFSLQPQNHVVNRLSLPRPTTHGQFNGDDGAVADTCCILLVTRLKRVKHEDCIPPYVCAYIFTLVHFLGKFAEHAS